MIQDVIDRLGTNAPSLKLIEGAAAFAALKKNPPTNQRPAAYVMLVSDTARPNQHMNFLSQTVTERFAVVVAEGDLGDRRGDAAAQAVELTRNEVKLALAGWKAPNTTRRVHYIGGRVIGLTNGVLWWQSDFDTQTILRNA